MVKRNEKSYQAGLLYALGAAIGLGAITTQAKLVYADGGNALTLMLWRFIVSVVVIGLVVCFKKQSFKVQRTLVGPVLIIGLVWSGAMIAYLLSVQTISVSVAVLILYSYPIIVLLVSIVVGRVKASISVMTLFIFAFIGIALMLSGGKVVLHIMGVVFAVFASMGAAYTFLSGSRIAPQLDPKVMTFWINVAGLVMVLPLVLGQYEMPRGTTGQWALIGATACYVVAILCQFEALAKLSADRAAFILNTEPVVSIMLALIVLNETLSVVQWLGVGTVISVLFVFSRIAVAK